MVFRRTGLPVVVMTLALAGYLAGRLLHGEGFDAVVDGWLAAATGWTTAAVCWLALHRSAGVRIEYALATVAVTATVAGDTYYTLAQDESGVLPSPSLADLGYMLFYALMLLALIVVVGKRLHGAAWPVFLDSAVAACGAATVLAVVLEPVVGSSGEAGLSARTVIAVAYPLFDLMLIAVVAAIFAARGETDGHWAPLVVGLLIFAAADVVFALGEASGAYSVGSALDMAWAVGIALIAVWVDRASRAGQPRRRRRTAHQALLLPGAATAAALAVLLLGSEQHVPVYALVLASATLVLAAVPMAFRHRLLRRLARTDDLTGLLNRRAFHDDCVQRLAAAAGAAAAGAGAGKRSGALLLLDLDRFKEINDSLGHEAGDRLLVQVGERLSRSLRTGDLLARLGGDEFAVLLNGSSADEADAVARKIRDALAGGFPVAGIELRTSVSIGVALFPGHGADANSLLRKADLAMYRAKTARSGHQLYHQDDDRQGELRLRTIQELRTALVLDQLVLHYQPQIDLATNEIHGVEALVRWDHPARGLLMPADFLDLAEECGLMHDLTLVVLQKALDQAAQWSSRQAKLTVAVNISASSLVDVGLPRRISAMLHERQLPASALILEITEDFLMADRDRARGILTELRGNGIQIAVDDFGTGYSSLAYLRELPIDELKLDQSFVQPMGTDPRASALVASTIALAHSLGLRIVAEGVETRQTQDELKELGCNNAQGHYVSLPVSAAELDGWLVSRRQLEPAPQP
ncbi:EAL domain-containing protein [Arthrobacter sp. AL08]|nr:EAL domain-containing protein [Arthrobacter sp. AL08]